ncbi:MAG: hypothetical protein NTAFB01_38500 [Nitrospira sp.]
MGFYAKNRNSRTEGSRVVRSRTRLVSLTIDDRLMESRLRDPNSSKNMVAVPWEDDE